jgi:hypothetical protein
LPHRPVPVSFNQIITLVAENELRNSSLFNSFSSRLGGVTVIVLASGPEIRVFKPDEAKGF